MTALTIDALYADGLIDFDSGDDPWSAEVYDERADALRDAYDADAADVDEPWMMEPHGGAAAVGFAVGERVLWCAADTAREVRS